MVTMAEGIAAATFAFKAAKDLREVDRSISEADFKLKIAILTESMADVKLAMIDLQDELRERDQTIKELKAALKTKEETVRVAGFYYAADNDQPVGKPFCTVCVDKGLFYRLEYAPGTRMLCPNCSGIYDRPKVFPNPNNL